MIKLLYSSSFSLGHLPTVMVSLLLMLVEKVNACSVTEHNASCYDDDDDDSLLYGAMFTSYQMACAFPFLFFFFLPHTPNMPCIYFMLNILNL